MPAKRLIWGMTLSVGLLFFRDKRLRQHVTCYAHPALLHGEGCALPTYPAQLAWAGFFVTLLSHASPIVGTHAEKRGPEEPIANLTERFKGQLSAPGHRGRSGLGVWTKMSPPP